MDGRIGIGEDVTEFRNQCPSRTAVAGALNLEARDATGAFLPGEADLSTGDGRHDKHYSVLVLLFFEIDEGPWYARVTLDLHVQIDPQLPRTCACPK
jgi:hypothetical protein